jgi:amino acid transporter/nucleotide-binding universal stress UspA family protein
MLVTESRPRNLKWFHAGPLLFGDWGTSRLYVLGLAFYYVGHASALYLGVMSVIMAAVAWAYTVVCRCFPEGGGVYTAARRLNPTLSVIGATMLLCDYIVTAALSGVEGFHYFGAPGGWVVGLCIGTIVLIGVINWLGARSAGRLALIIAVAAIACSALIAILCIPFLGAGLRSVTPHVDGVDSVWNRWESLVRIVLALSGVEAVANMTGLMRPPVARTARRTIWPVLIEVVVLNLIFGIALNAVPPLATIKTPDYITHEVRAGLDSDQVPPEVKEYRDTPVKLLATHTATHALGEKAGAIVGIGASIVFGLLLLSAVNTAIMAMVSVMYSMAQDRELPHPLTRLNYSGVPFIPLVVACAAPMVVLAFMSDPKALGELYAIGVVGAIAINLLSCAANRELPIGRWERRGLWALGALMSFIEVTIIFAKPRATLFAGILIALVLGTRTLLRLRAGREVPALPVPVAGWLAELKERPTKLEPGRPRIMLAARGRSQAQFAVDLARRRGAVLFAIYVRTLRVIDAQPGRIPRIEDDPGAQEALGNTAILARDAGVPFVPIYVTGTDIAEEILDYTVTYGCDTLIMGRSRRSFFARKIEGDVVTRVAALLPEDIALIKRSETAFEVPSQSPSPPRAATPPGPEPDTNEAPPT